MSLPLGPVREIQRDFTCIPSSAVVQGESGSGGQSVDTARPEWPPDTFLSGGVTSQPTAVTVDVILLLLFCFEDRFASSLLPQIAPPRRTPRGCTVTGCAGGRERRRDVPCRLPARRLRFCRLWRPWARTGPWVRARPSRGQRLSLPVSAEGVVFAVRFRFLVWP